VRVWHALHEISQLRHVWMSLVAHWLYIDGVDSILRMAVDYDLSLGFDHKSLLMALLITQFTGFSAAIAFGFLGNCYCPRAGLLIELLIYMVVTVRASIMSSPGEFNVLAFTIGLAQGGIQTLSRSLHARANRTTEFFGFYNMLGKFVAVIGPVMMGLAGAVSSSPRTGILSLLMLFVAGALVLIKVDVGRSQIMRLTSCINTRCCALNI
jgi:UMF1 family MFS transporter